MAGGPVTRDVAAMRIIVTLLVLVAGIGIVTAPNVLFPEAFTDGIQKLAAGWIGAVIGYWLS